MGLKVGWSVQSLMYLGRGFQTSAIEKTLSAAIFSLWPDTTDS